MITYKKEKKVRKNNISNSGSIHFIESVKQFSYIQ